MTPRAPNLSFLPREHEPTYDSWPSLAELMPESAPGVISHRDPLSVGFAAEDLLPKIRAFADLSVPDDEVKDRYELESSDRWPLHKRRQNFGGIVDPSLVKPLHFRPFDQRVIYDAVDVVGDRREQLRAHLERAPGNIALVAARRSSAEAPYAFVSRVPGTQALLSSRTLGAARFFPLFVVAATKNDALLPMEEHEQEATLNLALGWHDRLREAYGAHFSPEGFLGYLYGVLTSAAYRDRFGASHEEDYPRIPLPADAEVFELVATEGLRLVRAHLLEAPGLVTPRLEGTGDLIVGDPRHEDDRLWINASQYLEPVSAEAWTAKVGGYSPLELWLRNRAGRRLAGDDVRELARIAASIALGETLKPGIDAFVEDIFEAETLTLVPARPATQG